MQKKFVNHCTEAYLSFGDIEMRCELTIDVILIKRDMDDDHDKTMPFTDKQANFLCIFFSAMAILYGIGKILSTL